jgi:hypothetical protein
MLDEIIAGRHSKSSKKLCRYPDDLIYLRVCCKKMAHDKERIFAISKDGNIGLL